MSSGKVMKSLRQAILITGWLVFAASMFLPAVRARGAGMVSEDVLAGWQAAFLNFLAMTEVADVGIKSFRTAYVPVLAVCNIAMVLSPIFLLLRRGGRLQKSAFTIMAALACAAKFVFDDSYLDMMVGYYTWCLSFVLVAVALNMNSGDART